MVGKRIGRLVVLEKAPEAGRARWLCRCDCGNSKSVLAHHLSSEKTKSCGCIRSEVTAARNIDKATHGHASNFTRTPTYRTWTSMLTRCRNPKADNFEQYGGRGITVCERWLKFENFLADMGERPPGMTIDRRDNAKGYEPGNCRWATPSEQENNKTDNVIIEAGGRRQTVMQWSLEKGIYYHTLLKRLQAGWPIDRALNSPVTPRANWRVQPSQEKGSFA